VIRSRILYLTDRIGVTASSARLTHGGTERVRGDARMGQEKRGRGVDGGIRRLVRIGTVLVLALLAAVAVRGVALPNAAAASGRGACGREPRRRALGIAGHWRYAELRGREVQG
jgi:hypothetical protein